MGMTANQLVADAVDHIVDRELFHLTPKLGFENNVKENIAQFLAETVVVPIVDRLDHAVRRPRDHAHRAGRRHRLLMARDDRLVRLRLER